jgi:hypothetical protein
MKDGREKTTRLFDWKSRVGSWSGLTWPKLATAGVYGWGQHRPMAQPDASL